MTTSLSHWGPLEAFIRPDSHTPTYDDGIATAALLIVLLGRGGREYERLAQAVMALLSNPR